MEIENNFKGHKVEKTPKSNYANMAVFKNCQILMPQL